MRSSKEFFERLTTDEVFARAVGDAISLRREQGAANYHETIIPVAAEYGYEVTSEELDAINARQMEDLSEEELGKVAGGTSCLTYLAVISSAAVSIAGLVTLSKLEYYLKE